MFESELRKNLLCFPQPNLILEMADLESQPINCFFVPQPLWMWGDRSLQWHDGNALTNFSLNFTCTFQCIVLFTVVKLGKSRLDQPVELINQKSNWFQFVIQPTRIDPKKLQLSFIDLCDLVDWPNQGIFSPSR